jgi:hypothetical protein
MTNLPNYWAYTELPGREDGLFDPADCWGFPSAEKEGEALFLTHDSRWILRTVDRGSAERVPGVFFRRLRGWEARAWLNANGFADSEGRVHSWVGVAPSNPSC